MWTRPVSEPLVRSERFYANKSWSWKFVLTWFKILRQVREHNVRQFFDYFLLRLVSLATESESEIVIFVERDLMTKWKSKIEILRGVITSTESESEESFPFLLILFYNSVAHDPVKTRLSESETEAEEPTNHKARNRKLSLVYASACSFHLTMQFSLDRKRWRHKQNQCSASDSVGVIFTRSYHSTLVIPTLNTTPLLLKTSLVFK